MTTKKRFGASSLGSDDATSWPGGAELEVSPYRTHQIRVHLAAIGHPLESLVWDDAGVRTHPATVVSHGEWSAEVDIELAHLILEVWRAGVETIHSCQDVGENVAGLAVDLPHLEPVARREMGRASVGFADLDGMMAFQEALANSGPRDGFYERILHWASPGAWQCVIGIRDPGLEGDEGSAAADGAPRSRLVAASFQVRFPVSDVDEVTERLRRHNKGEAVALGRPTWEAITVDGDGPHPGQAT